MGSSSSILIALRRLRITFFWKSTIPSSSCWSTWDLLLLMVSKINPAPWIFHPVNIWINYLWLAGFLNHQQYELPTGGKMYAMLLQVWWDLYMYSHVQELYFLRRILHTVSFSIFKRTHINIYWHWTSHVFNINIHLDMAESFSNIWAIQMDFTMLLSFHLEFYCRSLGNREWVVCFDRSALVHLPMLTLSCAVLAVGDLSEFVEGQNLSWRRPKLLVV